MGLKGKESIANTISSNSKNETPNEKRRIELFHRRVISKHNKIDTLFDSGSQANLIFENIFKSLNLETFHIINHIHLDGCVTMHNCRLLESVN